MRLVYRGQRDALVGELARRLGADLAVSAPDQGMHVVAYVRDGLSDIAIEEAARESGVVVRAMSRFYKTAPARSALMLGFTGYPPPRLVHATARLAAVIESQPKADKRRGPARDGRSQSHRRSQQ